MFPKFIKNSFLVLILFSYGSTAISMEQPNPSWWQRAKNWWFHQPDQSKAERKRKNRLRKQIIRQIFVNGAYVARGLNGLYECYYSANANLPTLQTINDGLPQEQIDLIKNVLLPMGVPPDTRISIEQPVPGYSNAATHHKRLIIYPALFNLLNPSEQAGVIGHEGGHIINNDALKKSIFALCLPVISWGVLKGYDWGSAKLIAYLRSKYPGTNDHLKNLENVNQYLAKSWVTQTILNHYFWIMFARSHEWRADYVGAQAVGADGLKMYFEKASDPKYIEKLKQIKVNESEIGWIDLWNMLPNLLGFFCGQLGILATHPSYEARIKALVALDKK